MNIQLANVISDIVGATGQKILRVIVVQLQVLAAHTGTPKPGKERSRARNAPKFDLRV